MHLFSFETIIIPFINRAGYNFQIFHSKFEEMHLLVKQITDWNSAKSRKYEINCQVFFKEKSAYFCFLLTILSLKTTSNVIWM